MKSSRHRASRYLPGRIAAQPLGRLLRVARHGTWLCSAAALALASAPTGQAGTPQLEGERRCAQTQGFTCSTLTVPLDHSGTVGGTLRLRVAASRNRDAPRGVLLFLAGGPGQPAVSFVGRIAERLAPVPDAYRLVVLDQRGTGAGALECPALQRAMGFSDLIPAPAAAVRACGASIGAKRRFFGTDDVVADLDLLRRALGADRWSLDGVSYGSFVAERYALAHPRRVDRLVLDSVVPHDGVDALGTTQMRAVGRVLRDVCGNDCVSDLATVVRTRHAGPALLDRLTLLSIIDPSFSRQFDIPRLLRAAARGDASALRQFLTTTATWSAATASQLSQGLHASALCSDWRFPWGHSGSAPGDRSALLARAAARLRSADLGPFDRATATGNGIVRQCLPWPATPPTSQPRPGRKLPSVPTLLLAGSRDLSTPLEWARREASLAPRGRLVVVAGAGHSVQMRAVSEEGRRAVARFLGARP
jgi:pimeloyl-ACP methyl ester carboxylesterase